MDQSKALSVVPCTACHLSINAKSKGVGYSWPYRPEKNPPRPILFVGEGPGRNEDLEGKPFVGNAGKFLWDTIDRIGIPREAVALSNVVQCVPWEDPTEPTNTRVRPPTDLEVAICQCRLLREIHELKPALIVPVGMVAAHYLLERGVRPSARNKKFSIEKLRAKIYHSTIAGVTYPIFPTFHPSGVLRDWIRSHIFELDMANIREIYNGTFNKVPNTVVPKTTEEAVALIRKATKAVQSGKSDFVAVDLETSGLEPWGEGARIVGIALSWGQGVAVYIPYSECGSGQDVFFPAINQEAVREAMREMFQVCPIANQNLKFDNVWFWELWGFGPIHIYGDPWAMAHMIHGEYRLKTNSLDALGRDYCHYGAWDEPVEKWFADNLPGQKNKDYSLLPLSITSLYAGIDAECAWRLVKLFEKDIADKGLVLPMYITVLAITSFSKIEMAGLAVDLKALKAMGESIPNHLRDVILMVLDDPMLGEILDKKNPGWKTQLELKKSELNYKQIIKLTGFNPSSPVQVAELLFDKYHITFDVKWATEKGGKSVAAKVLKEIVKRQKRLDATAPVLSLLQNLLEFRLLEKINTSYVRKLPRFTRSDGTLQVKYQITGTRSGRLSTTDFGVHTIPKSGRADVKNVFVSRWRDPLSEVKLSGSHLHYPRTWQKDYPERGGGLILSADYSQLELRCLALIAGDKGMIQAFVDGKDLHKFVASKVFYPDIDKLATVDSIRLEELHKAFLSSKVYDAVLKRLGVQEKVKSKQDFQAAMREVVIYLIKHPADYEKIRYGAVTKSQRSLAKAISFGLVYGASPEKIASQAEDMKYEDAMKFIKDYFVTFEAVAIWIEEQHKLAKKRGFAASPVGRIRWLPLAQSWNEYDQAKAFRIAQNHPIQSGASDICLLAVSLLMQAMEARQFRSRTVGSVHDSILNDIFPGELLEVASLTRRVMETDVREHPGFNNWITKPIIVADLDVGPSWGTMVGIKELREDGLTVNGPPQDVRATLDLLERAYHRVEQLDYKEETTSDGLQATASYRLERLGNKPLVVSFS